MKHPHGQYASLIPILAAGCIMVLVILVFRSYIKTAAMQPTIILPGGKTYLGQ